MILGSCSLCGGPVRQPPGWFKGYPPIPRCDHCGAHAADTARVIPSKPADRPIDERFRCFA